MLCHHLNKLGLSLKVCHLKKFVWNLSKAQTYLTPCKAWPTKDEHSVFENQGTRSVRYCLQIESKLARTESERVDFQRQMIANIGVQGQNGLCSTWSGCWTLWFRRRCNRARVVVTWTAYRAIFLARALLQIIVKLSAAYKDTFIAL